MTWWLIYWFVVLPVRFLIAVVYWTFVIILYLIEYAFSPAHPDDHRRTRKW